MAHRGTVKFFICDKDVNGDYIPVEIPEILKNPVFAEIPNPGNVRGTNGEIIINDVCTPAVQKLRNVVKNWETQPTLNFVVKFASGGHFDCCPLQFSVFSVNRVPTYKFKFKLLTKLDSKCIKV